MTNAKYIEFDLVGDILVLYEFDPKTEKYTGNVIRRKVTYVLYGGRLGVPNDYCIMQLSPLPDAPEKE